MVVTVLIFGGLGDVLALGDVTCYIARETRFRVT